MLQSKITLVEGGQGEPSELTLAKFNDEPTMLIMTHKDARIAMELDNRQMLQLMHFINILLETS